MSGQTEANCECLHLLFVKAVTQRLSQDCYANVRLDSKTTINMCHLVDIPHFLFFFVSKVLTFSLFNGLNLNQLGIHERFTCIPQANELIMFRK